MTTRAPAVLKRPHLHRACWHRAHAWRKAWLLNQSHFQVVSLIFYLDQTNVSCSCFMLYLIIRIWKFFTECVFRPKVCFSLEWLTHNRGLIVASYILGGSVVTSAPFLRAAHFCRTQCTLQVWLNVASPCRQMRSILWIKEYMSIKMSIALIV